MRPKQRPEDIPREELAMYEAVYRRWIALSPEQVLKEAATIFNLAVKMVSRR